MDTSRVRTVGVQTWVCTSHAYTQTTCFDAVYGYSENLADWIISEAFKYGRDLEKFASCIVDCILMEVFMAKSLRNLALYVEECKEADKPYTPVDDVRNTSKEANLRKAVQHGEETRNEAFYPCRSEFNCALSSPDTLQMLEDDIIRCLQTLTDDEEELISAHPNSDCFSDTSFYQQLSELDSGFLSSEDALSVDQRAIGTKKSNLPSLTEELEDTPKFKWPSTVIGGKCDDNALSYFEASVSRTRAPFNEHVDHLVERQKTLRNLLVDELKLSVECRRRKIEGNEGTLWSPGQQMSAGIQDQQFQTNDFLVTTRTGNLDDVERQNQTNSKCHRLNGSPETNSSEDLKKIENFNSISMPSMTSQVTNSAKAVVSGKPCQDAVVVDKKVTIENNEIHTDSYYAAPVQEVTTKTRIIKAPTYDGIGPTEDGIPTGLRTAVQKEYSSDWYKSMFRSLHRQGKSEEKRSDGYMSDPEFVRKEKHSFNKDDKNLSSINTDGSYQSSSANDVKNAPNQPFPAAKSSYTPYNHKPWIISDYEPGHSSIAEVEAPHENKRHLPPLNSPKPKYIWNDGYESDSTLIRKTGKIHALNPQEQKQWYQEIQRGGDIPIHGLGKPAPEKIKEPVVGPPPPFPDKWDADHYYSVYSTVETDPNSSEVSSLYHAHQNLINHSQEKLPKMQDEFRSKLDEVLLNRHEENIRHSPKKSPVGNNQANSKNPSASGSTYPYKVTVLYDFEAETSRELSLRKGDIVTIRRKIDRNWLEGEHHGTVGILPLSYVESASAKPTKTTAKIIEGSVRAKFDFAAQNSVELSLHKDDVVILMRQVDSNWYEGKLNGKVGIFPISYVEVISGQQHAASPLQTSVPNSAIYEVEKSKKEIVLHPSEKKNQEVSLEKETESENESEKKIKMVISNHEGNKVIPYKSIYAYKPQNDDELELREGDIVYVVEKCDDGWFVGTSMRTGLFGTFPGNYVQKI